MITVEAITSFNDFLRTRGYWNDLVARSDNDSPFMRFEWFAFFWRKFCRGTEPLILVVKNGGEPVAIAPLARSRIRWRGLPVTCLGFMANYFSIRTGLIAARGADGTVIEPVFRFLQGSRIGFDMLSADLIVKDSLTDAVLSARASRHAAGYAVMAADSNPYVRIDGTWENYLATRTKHQRFNIRHLDKQYERGLRYAVTTYTAQKLDEAAEKMLFISRHSWKHTRHTAICDDPVKVDFYREFMSVAAEAGWLRFKVLEIEDVPAAFSYELACGAVLYILKIGYNDAFRKFAPGAFLMNNSIKDAFISGRRECELLGANEEWKQKMCDHSREHVKYWIFTDSAYGKFLYAWERRIVSAVKYLRDKARPDPQLSQSAP